MIRNRLTVLWLVVLAVTGLFGLVQTALGAEGDQNIIYMHGTVEAISDANIVVNGHDVAIKESTEFYGTPEVDDKVHMRVYVGDERALTALRIRVDDHDDSDEDRYTVVEGSITAVSETEVAVSDTVLLLDDDTRVRGTLEVGADAKAWAYENEAGSLVALVIYADNGERRVHIKGEVTALSEDSVTVDEQVIMMTDSTEVSGTLAIGVDVRGSGVQSADGTITATYLRVLPERPEYVRVVGPITTFDDTSVTISGTTILLSDTTRIDGTLAVNAMAKAWAVELESGALLGLKIRVHNESEPEGHPVVIVGKIVSFTESSITIRDKVFTINDDTEIEGTLAVGAYARVKGIYNESARASLVATKIHVREHQNDTFSFTGIVQAISGTKMTVRDRDIMITDDTEISGTLQVDARVFVIVERQDDGSLVADAIRVLEDTSGLVHRIGRISALTDSTMEVRDTLFTIDENTVVIGTLAIDAKVAVLGEQTDSMITALKVRVLNAVESSGDVDAISADSITIAGQTYALTGDTHIEGDIEIGAQVTIGQDASRAAAGDALYITSNSAPTAVTLSGSNAAQSSSTAVVLALLALAIATLATSRLWVARK